MKFKLANKNGHWNSWFHTRQVENHVEKAHANKYWKICSILQELQVDYVLIPSVLPSSKYFNGLSTRVPSLELRKFGNQHVFYF